MNYATASNAHNAIQASACLNAMSHDVEYSYSQSSRPIVSSRLVTGSLAFILLGTGSNFQAESSDFSGIQSVVNLYVTQCVNFNEELSFDYTVIEKIEKIRAVLKITVTDVSKAIGVTRPAVYGWMKGVEPHAEAITKINALFEFAKILDEYKLHRPDVMLKRPMFDGHSALELIQAGNSLSELQLDSLIKLDAREFEVREAAIGQKLLPIRTHRDVLDDFDSLSWDDKEGA